MRILDPRDPSIPEIGPANEPLVRAINADDLVAAFEENGLAAERQFAGQLLSVTGEVGTVHRARSGALVVNMPASIVGAVACAFPETAFDELAALRRGQRLVVVGECVSGRSLTVRLKDCAIPRVPDPAGEAAVGRAA